MHKMPEKSPELWTALVMWLASVSHHLYAPTLAAAIAVFRVIYGGGSRRQMLLEGVLCGLATLGIKPLLIWLGMPSDMAVFAGAVCGFVGVEKLRDWAEQVGDYRLKRKAGD
ncbi:phage holin, lambda family [Pseudomonas sp.]|uniref:phage holin, lambda family n=1 Tax=Pseudomonas sp. TaxID=306 RepID=UPI0025890086|nr:phage holin, lambda family [Pseudomonas sp.]